MSKKYKDIKGSVGIRVNTFNDDTPLDVALRLLRHVVLEVDDAVKDLSMSKADYLASMDEDREIQDGRDK